MVEGNATRVIAALCVIVVAAVAAPAAVGAERVAHLPGPRIALPEGTSAEGMAVGPDGTLYVGLNRGGAAGIAAFDRDGRLLREWPVDALTTTRGPLVVAVGADGNVYAAQHVDYAAGVEAVRVFRPDGTPVRTFGEGSGLFQVTDMELDAAGNVYLTSRARPDLGLPDDHVARFDAAGNLTGRFVPDPGHPDAFGNGLVGLASPGTAPPGWPRPAPSARW